MAQEPIKILKNKYPAVYDLLKRGDEGVVQWIVDNIHLLREKKEAYTVVKESGLVSVDKEGNHNYKKV